MVTGTISPFQVKKFGWSRLFIKTSKLVINDVFYGDGKFGPMKETEEDSLGALPHDLKAVTILLLTEPPKRWWFKNLKLAAIYSVQCLKKEN